MAVTRSTLRAKSPEFTDAPDAVVDAMIAEAQATVNTTTLGDSYDYAVHWLACDLLARSPFARDMRLSTDGKMTVYRENYLNLIKISGLGNRVWLT